MHDIVHDNFVVMNDSDTLTDEIWFQISHVREKLREMDISVDDMKEKSKAAAGLMKFVYAVIGYCEVAKEVKPKREKVKEIEFFQIIKISFHLKISEKRSIQVKIKLDLSKIFIRT